MGHCDSDAEARAIYLSLHRHLRNGYERGDCHCHECGEKVELLTAFFGITPPPVGIHDPARVIRDRAAGRWGFAS